MAVHYYNDAVEGFIDDLKSFINKLDKYVGMVDGEHYNRKVETARQILIWLKKDLETNYIISKV